jgi:hypothetical protein
MGNLLPFQKGSNILTADILMLHRSVETATQNSQLLELVTFPSDMFPHEQTIST